MSPRLNSAAVGIGHRLISMVPGLLAFVATAFDYHMSERATAIFPVLGAVVLILLGFMAPAAFVVESFGKPMPNAESLAIGSKGLRNALLGVGICLLFGPGTVRFVARLVGAA